MAKDVITRFKLETTGFDSKIKQAANELSAYSKTATQAKEGFNQFTKANVDAARALGTMATSTTNVKDKVKELVSAYNNAAKAYEALTKEQQQSDWAKALAGSLTQLQQRIKETKQEMQGLSSGGGLFSGDKLSGMLQVFGGNLMTKAAGAVANLGSEMAGMIKQGIELSRQGEGIRIAFERLGRGDILQGLREATHGTVTDLELMKAAVKFNDFKLPVSELGTMLAFAQQKAKDTGQSVDYMVDSIVTGLGRKSLMILDNLGLSATEVKEKMKETGDMTKAVGAIIREQMAKAGDYVETAADRAAQANVSLQNKMEELGRKFAPIEEASNQLWTSMKIGILDIIGGPLAQLLNGLTEAGRITNSMQKHGGNDRVSGQVQRYRVAKANGSSYMANYIDQQNLKSYDDEINRLQFTIAAYGKGRDAVEKGNIARLKEELQGVRNLRAEYIKMRNEADRPSAINSPTTTTTTTKKTTKTGKTPDQIIREQFAAQQRDSLAYSSSYKSTAADQPSDAWRAFTESQTQASKSIEDALQALNKKEGVTARGKGNEKKKQDDALKQDKSAVQVLGQMNSGISGIMSGIEGLGIELPEGLQNVLGGMQAITTILTGIATTVLAIEAIAGADALIPFANGGVVPGFANGGMIDSGHSPSFLSFSKAAPAFATGGVVPQTITSIPKFATGGIIPMYAGGGTIPASHAHMFISYAKSAASRFASGGTIPHAANGYFVGGTHFSGDVTPIMANAGELVLNKAQQGVLANQLQGGGIQNLNLTATIKGEQIRLALNNNSRRRGRGEYVTSKNEK